MHMGPLRLCQERRIMGMHQNSKGSLLAGGECNVNSCSKLSGYARKNYHLFNLRMLLLTAYQGTYNMNVVHFLAKKEE